MMLRRNCVELEQLIGRVRFGQGGSLVVLGEAGAGKTTLLGKSLDLATGCRVVDLGGVATESELAFAAIHRLSEQMWDGLERLPDPQADALRSALGLTTAGGPDGLLVGLAVRSLLAGAADQRPLVCLVDDAQWLDGPSARALAFVARRLDALPVGLVFAARERREELVGLPEVAVEGLSVAEARSLVDRAFPGPFDDDVRARIVSETQGNPVAVADTLRLLSPVAIAGGFGAPSAIPLPTAMEESFRRRLEPLPDDTRLLLLVAAAEPLGRPRLLWRAADVLGIPATAADCADAAGLLRFGALVGFRHPAMRSAVYRAASPDERRRVHRALAQATDAEMDPDRRAWHRGEAASAPDEAVAAELDGAAGSAQAKGGLIAAAALLDRAAALTPDPVRRSERMFAAGRAKLAAGATDEALELLVKAEPKLLETREGARLEQLLVRIVVAQRGGSDAPALLLSAARRLSPLDAGLSRETYLAALEAAIQAGHIHSTPGLAQVASAAGAAPPPPQPARAVDLLLDGLAALFSDRHTIAMPVLKQALRMLELESEPRWLALGAGLASDLWDDATARALAGRQKELALRNGAMRALRRSLSALAQLSVYAGDFTAAADLIEQACTVPSHPVTAAVPCASLMLAAFRGAEAETARLIEVTIEHATLRGEGRVIAFAEEMTAVLQNSLGNYRDALTAAQQAAEHGQLGASDRALAELIEAAVRCGEREIGQVALARLDARTRFSGTDWALGIEARSRALLSESQAADQLYRTAIERLGRCSVTTALARAHLLYGEWLRREARRVEARQHLHIALHMFTTMGAQAFADRTERELLASGERLHKQTVEPRTQLTSQEAQISQFALDGYSNPEIAAKLYLSPRTVEYHLRKVFMKLGIRSRNELHRVLGPAEVHPSTASRPREPNFSSPQPDTPR
ncbi:MAG: transcriptional regulator, luxR family [Pseudonocardiales bacterium]|nr:transcriptional regulator, luxR family [Pseudonocardiales bacterium]